MFGEYNHTYTCTNQIDVYSPQNNLNIIDNQEVICTDSSEKLEMEKFHESDSGRRQELMLALLSQHIDILRTKLNRTLDAVCQLRECTLRAISSKEEQVSIARSNASCSPKAIPLKCHAGSMLKVFDEVFEILKDDEGSISSAGTDPILDSMKGRPAGSRSSRRRAAAAHQRRPSDRRGSLLGGSSLAQELRLLRCLGQAAITPKGPAAPGALRHPLVSLRPTRPATPRARKTQPRAPRADAQLERQRARDRDPDPRLGRHQVGQRQRWMLARQNGAESPAACGGGTGRMAARAIGSRSSSRAAARAWLPAQVTIDPSHYRSESLSIRVVIDPSRH